MLKLFYAPGSCSLASHIALEEAGADYAVERVDLRGGQQRTAAYLAVNPKGRVPALLTDRGVLTENPVILGYIAQTHPDVRLAPVGDSFAFGDMQAFNMFLAATVHVAFAHVFRPERYGEGEEAARAMRAAAVKALAGYFGLIEEKLADGRPFAHGRDYTVSDPYLFVFSRWLDTRSLDGRKLGCLADFPRVAAHYARVGERPAVVKALAEEATA
ncbi:MAG: glutathione S-transferase family protein [Caulobacteraceae bacterium]